VRINILERTITRKQTNLEIDVFRKSTTSDTTVNFLSNHSTEHKMAAFRYHIPRMCSIPLTPEKKHEEWELIQPTVRNNFPQNLLQKLNRQTQHKTSHEQTEGKEDKKLGQHSPTIALK